VLSAKGGGGVGIRKKNRKEPRTTDVGALRRRRRRRVVLDGEHARQRRGLRLVGDRQRGGTVVLAVDDVTLFLAGAHGLDFLAYRMQLVFVGRLVFAPKVYDNITIR